MTVEQWVKDRYPYIPNPDKDPAIISVNVQILSQRQAAIAGANWQKEQDGWVSVEDAKKLRDYFGKNDRTPFEHWAYYLFDRIIPNPPKK